MLTERKKILYVVEAMGGGVFTYIVDLANALVDTYDMYIAYAVRKQTPKNYRDYFDKRIKLVEVKNFCREIKPTKELAAPLFSLFLDCLSSTTSAHSGISETRQQLP